MSDIPIILSRTPHHRAEVHSYRCTGPHPRHDRCTGLVSPSGTLAYLCACDCGCNDRPRTAASKEQQP